jgi:hypothetical protein
MASLIDIVATFANPTQGAATGFPSPFLSLSLQILHATVVKKNYYRMRFPFLGLEDLHNNDVQTTNVEDMTKKLLHDSRQRSCT